MDSLPAALFLPHTVGTSRTPSPTEKRRRVRCAGERRVYAAGAVHGRPALSLLLEEKVAFGVSRSAE